MIPVKDILITPEPFFSQLCKKEESFRIPIIIILIVGFIGGLSAYIVTSKTLTMMTAGMEGLMLIAGIIAFIAAIIGTFLYWILWTAGFFIMNYICKGKATFKRLAEVSAYGFIPQIFGGIISTFVMAMALPSLVLSSTDNVQEIEIAMKAFTTSPAMVCAMFIGLIFTIWSANIWIFGIKEASNLEFKKAVVCVTVPLIIYILLTISSLYM